MMFPYLLLSFSKYLLFQIPLTMPGNYNRFHDIMKIIYTADAHANLANFPVFPPELDRTLYLHCVLLRLLCPAL
jgi:hypothetical protein